MFFDLQDSISEQYLFLTSAMKIRFWENPGAMHESMLSDVHIDENAPPPLPCIITEWPPFAIHVINVMFRQSNNENMSTLYLTLPPPPIWESKPLVAIDILGWAISLRILNRDLEGFVNNWRPNPFHTFTKRLFCYFEEVLNCPALCST